MAKQHTTIPPNLQPWLAARTKYRLSHAQVQMARELGMNPKKFGSLANHRQEPWKVPLPEFIEECYRKRFGQSQPADPRSIEERVAAQAAQKTAAKVHRVHHPLAEAITPEQAFCHQSLSGSQTMDTTQRSRVEASDTAIALYHLVYAHEGFEEAAQAVFTLVQAAQQRHPGKKRTLYLDIEGHRQGGGGFDPDMVELQQTFLLGFLSPYLSEIHAPLVRATNTKPQANELPPTLVIQTQGNERQ
jgi:hypothetical protein